MNIQQTTGTILPHAWENALLKCWNHGDTYPTQYDKPGDPLSKDVLAIIEVLTPMAEPRIHMGMPGGYSDLEKYRAEFLYGVHDHWINPQEGKWSYTYSHRMQRHFGINQIKHIIEMLRECGHTRRALISTWDPKIDLHTTDPPCVQNCWFRINKDNKLEMVMTIRSNDAFKAGFMNMFVFTELQFLIAKALGIEVGRYVHIAFSFHIYGSYFKEFDKFHKLCMSREWPERTITTEDCAQHMIPGIDELLGEEDLPAWAREPLEQRRIDLTEIMKKGPL